MLPHNSYVSMAESKNRNFVYLSSSKDYQRQYPSELRNKYIVSKELGKVSHSNISFKDVSLTCPLLSEVLFRTILSSLSTHSSNIENLKIRKNVELICIIYILWNF